MPKLLPTTRTTVKYSSYALVTAVAMATTAYVKGTLAPAHDCIETAAALAFTGIAAATEKVVSKCVKNTNVAAVAVTTAVVGMTSILTEQAGKCIAENSGRELSAQESFPLALAPGVVAAVVTLGILGAKKAVDYCKGKRSLYEKINGASEDEFPLVPKKT